MAVTKTPGPEARAVGMAKGRWRRRVVPGLVLGGLALGAILLSAVQAEHGARWAASRSSSIFEGSSGKAEGGGIDLSRYVLTFSEDFDRFDRRSKARPDGLWDTQFVRFKVRRLPDNHERQIYMDPDYAGSAPLSLGVDPFGVKDGVLTIEARPADPERVRPHIENMPYTSGMISTERSFAQQYGYFEIRARLPAGKGLWPAFWMLSTSGRWPPEIDVFENLGKDPRTLYTNAHHPDIPMGRARLESDDVTAWHRYGVEWTPETITWFLDGRRINTMPNIVNEPMYLIANLAVGGEKSWPGAPDETTVFPARMEIDYIRAYAPTPQSADAAPR